jgi:excisionase family DNA binding protein
MSDLPSNAEVLSTTRLLVRVEDAAGILSLSRSKVYELLAAGELQGVTIGRSRRIPVDCLREYVTRLRLEDDI